MACADVDILTVSVQDDIVVLPVDDRDSLLLKNDDCSSKSDVQFRLPFFRHFYD